MGATEPAIGALVTAGTLPRVGVVGAGLWGRSHVRACAELGILGGVFDADESFLAALESYDDVVTFRDFRALLRAVDAVVVATPAVSHAPIALAAIKAGKHVLVEKPLALSIHDAERIADAGERAGLCVGVGNVLLHHPAMTTMLDAIERGAIGRVSHVRVRRCNLGQIPDVENVWWSFSLRDIGIAIAIFGASPVGIGAALHATRGRITDFAYADLDFGCARSAHLEASWLDPQRSASIEVFGNTGVLAFEDAGTTCRLTKRASGAADRHVESWAPAETMSFANEAPLVAELRAFGHAAVDKTAFLTNARSDVAVMHVLAALEDVALRTRLEHPPARVAAPYPGA